LATFVNVHVIISLIAIVAGIIAMFGMLGSRRPGGLTAIFLLPHHFDQRHRFLIPPLVSEKLLPSHIIGGLSLVLLLIACLALYGMKLSGAWPLDLCGDRVAVALLQRVRAGDPELPQDSRVDGGGAGQPALRAGVSRWCRAWCWWSSC